MFASIEDVIERFGRLQYIASRTIGTVVYLASHLKKPVLVEGPAGVGKTELAKVVAQALGHELIRLQCYEGLDEAKALYEWEYAKQLLYTQILKDKISEVLGGARSLREAVDKIASEDDVFFSDRFILPRPLLRAITAEAPCVLLIDEVDKSDTEVEAFLLEVLSDFQVSVPELGTLHARHLPTVVLTSNNARELSDALKRRCLHLFIDFPDRAQELEIVKLKVPGVSERLAAEVVTVVHRIRKLDLKKAPSISETLDWAKALTLLNVKRLDDRETVRATLRASMVKRTIDIPAFEQLFALFFSGLADAIAEATAATRGALGLDDPDFQRLLEELERLLRERGIELSPLARALLAADGGRLQRLLREAGERARVGDIQQGFQEGRFAHAVAGALGLGALARELERLKAELEGSADARRLAEYLERRLQDLNDMIKAMVRGELERQDVGRRDHERLAALADKSFFYLTEEEIRRMQEAVQKLAQRLRHVISIRRRRARRGKFDPSGTLRRNLQYRGVPFRIVWDRRKKEKPQVMVLCDVSDSVRNVSRFMLQFVYSLQDLYSKVRSFVFVAEVGEITRLFEA